jgi:hypothetical protein
MQPPGDDGAGTPGAAPDAVVNVKSFDAASRPTPFHEATRK